ncbi:MAG: response regulator transcription factor, partial [Desulfocurvibacter africanus]
MKILLVEDDQKITSFIVKGFRQAGFAIDSAIDGKTGLHLALANAYDAAIVDIMIPELDGLSLIEEIRKQKVYTPVIILSAKRSVDDRIKGLQKGGDDYLVKPFAFSELLARVQALIRRSSFTPQAECLVVEDLSLNLSTRQVYRGDEKIDLKAKELALLEYLLRNQGRVVSKTMILERVWDYRFDPQRNLVDVLICRLRNRVDRQHDMKLIHTIRERNLPEEHEEVRFELRLANQSVDFTKRDRSLPIKYL